MAVNSRALGPAWRSTRIAVSAGNASAVRSAASAANATPRPTTTPRLDPPRAGFTATAPREGSTQRASNHARIFARTADERTRSDFGSSLSTRLSSLAARTKAGRTGNPARRSVAAHEALSKAASAAREGLPTNGTPADSSAARRTPSSPNAPWIAGNAIAPRRLRCAARARGEARGPWGAPAGASGSAFTAASSRPSWKSKSLGVLQ